MSKETAHAKYLENRDQKLAASTAYYKANHDHCLAMAKARRLRWEPMRRFVADYKSRPCVDCGDVFHPFVMDFDHVRGEKIGDVSAMLSQLLPFIKIWAEIEKCDVVCANCHRMRTFRRSTSNGA